MKVTFAVTTTEVAGKEVRLLHDFSFSPNDPREIILPGSPLDLAMKMSDLRAAKQGNGKPISSAPAKRKPGRPKGSLNKRSTPHTVSKSIVHGVGGPTAPRYGRLGITEADLHKVEQAIKTMDGALSPVQRAVLRHYFGIGVEAKPLKQIAPLIGSEVWRMTPELRKALKALGIRRRRRSRLTSTRRGGMKGDSQMQIRLGERREGTDRRSENEVVFGS